LPLSQCDWHQDREHIRQRPERNEVAGTRCHGASGSQFVEADAQEPRGRHANGGAASKKGKKENMKKLMQKAKRSGQSLVEYGLVLALIAIVAILVVKAVGTKTASTFDNIQSTMTSQGVAATTPQSASS